MNLKNKIGWCSASWNPIVGCSPVSEGCQNCYAAGISHRFGLPWGKAHFMLGRLNQPSKEKKPQHIFVCSMGDLFHPTVPFPVFCDVWREMVNTPRHTFLVLTKRPTLMRDMVGDSEVPVPPHIWLGVTAENQVRADERIPILLSIPAAKHFVSVEPMLGLVDLSEWRQYSHPKTPISKLDWVIAGPETGPKKRPCKDEWIEDLYKQSEAAGVPFWDKRKNYIERKRP